MSESHEDTSPVSGVQVAYPVDRIAIQHVPLLSISVKVVNTARDLGVYIDRSLTMSDHVAAVCCVAYFPLRQLRLVTRSLTVDAAKSLVQAFITCRLHCCNSLCGGITDSLLSFGICSLFRMRQHDS